MRKRQLRTLVALGVLALAGGLACRDYQEHLPRGTDLVGERAAGARQSGAGNMGYSDRGTSLGNTGTINGTNQTEQHAGRLPSDNRVQAGGIGSIGVNEQLAGPAVQGPGFDSRDLFGQRGVGGAGQVAIGGAGGAGQAQDAGARGPGKSPADGGTRGADAGTGKR